MALDPTDPEIIAFIAKARFQTFTALAKMVARKFGDERAWPVELAATTWRDMQTRWPRSRSRFQQDDAVMAFIADRADLVTIAALGEAGVRHFGEARFPKHSQLHRLVVKARAAARKKARGGA